MDFEIFKTERLELRKLTPSDFNYIFENYPEAEIRMFLGISSDIEFAKELNKYKNGYSTYNRSFVFFQMLSGPDQQIIGGCGFHNWFKDHRRAEIGYALKNDAFKGKGLMTEALPFLLEYGFKQMDLNRIEAFIGSENTASLKLVTRYNFTREGVLRQHYINGDKIENSIVFSLLREEYLNF
jgi:[ribosomal protein S5]-alanine N-acetyltransferase